MTRNVQRSEESRWMKCFPCFAGCCPCCTQQEWRKCCPCCTQQELMKCFPCFAGFCPCCTQQDENQTLMGDDSGRQVTIISQQPTPSSSGNNVCTWDKTAEKTENPPKSPEKTTKTSDKTQEKTLQKTKSNQVQPQEPTSESPYRESSAFEDKLEQMRRAMRGKLPTQKVKVGICSRAAESEYQWLKAKLESEPFVRSVLDCYISNNKKQEFWDNVSLCNFGILYHSQNRGRINLTDVRDSLYDEELQYLSEKLGKKKVIVVIDDLTDSSDERKREILENQPKLQSLATDVFLFSGEEKKPGNTTEQPRAGTTPPSL